MDDTTNITSDYGDWVSDPGNTSLHVEAILTRIAPLPTPEQAAEVARRRQWSLLVNTQTGHLNEYELCWICAGTGPYSGRHLPRFRACRWCLEVDRIHASSLGLKHLLPVFDWPSPPVIRPGGAHRLSTQAREAIGKAWSEVSVLDRWRRDRVQIAYEWMEIPADEEGIDLNEWRTRLRVGTGRSVGLWAEYVRTHQPALHAVLQETGDQE